MSILDPRYDLEYTRRLRRVVICLDDIDDIVGYLGKENCQNITIRAGKAVVEDGTDDLLSATRKEVGQLLITASDPNIGIRLGSIDAYVATRDSTARARSVVDGAHQLAMDQQRFYGV